MKKILILLTTLAATNAFAVKAKIQNEDVKSLANIQAAVLTTTGNLTSGNACIASPGSTTGLSAGQFIYDSTTPANITSGTTIVGLPGTCSAGQIQMSAVAGGNGTGDTITFGGQASQLINDTKIWVTSVTPNQQLSSAISKGVIGGTGGSKNYLTTYNGNTGNGNFEFGTTTGWSLGTIGTLTNGLPTGSPTFGSGASGNLSIATVSSGQIAGSYSLSYVSSAATTAGNMLASNAFTIDTEDQAKVLTVKFYYTANSGAANDNFSGTSSNSFAWAAWDATNSAWLTSAGNFCMVQGSGVGYCTGTLQTASSTTSMRFALYNANATSGATTIYLDDFSVGPQTAPIGPSMSDPVSYTPTYSASLGTVTTSGVSWSRLGKNIIIKGRFTTGTTTGATATVQLPSGLSWDTTIAVGTITASGWSTSSSHPNLQPTVTSPNLIQFIDASSASGTAMLGSDIGTGAIVDFMVIWPIVGWSSNSVASSDTDTRVVDLSVTKTATQSVTANVTNVSFTSVAKDSHGAWNGTDTYTVPVSGDYIGCSSIGDLGSTSWNATIYLNGSSFRSIGSQAGGNNTGGCALLPGLAAGNLLTLRISATTTVNTSGSLSIMRVSGPAVVTATESVSAFYTTANTTPISGSLASGTAVVAYTSKVKDTHNAYNTTTGVYTIPVSGSYSICSQNRMVTTFSAIGNQSVQADIGINGTDTLGLASIISQQSGNIGTYFPSGCVIAYPFKAGDQVTILLGAGGTSPSIGSTASVSWFNISRVGN